MALYFPGTIGWKLPGPTTQFRYDVGIAGGHLAFSIWIKPDDVNVNREIVAIVEAAGYVLTVLRLADAGSGCLTAITQADLFGFCTVRRTVNDVIVPNIWQNIVVACDTSMADMHLYVDGVEPTFAFTRSEAGLPMNGGGDILLGTNFRGDGISAPHYPCGLRVFSGDLAGGWTHDPALVFSTSPGTFFKGGLAHAGFWHAGMANIPEQVEAIAAGYSPLFLNHKIESSSFSFGLLMAPGLYGESVDEQEPRTGITAEETIGSGHLSWIDGPPVVEPCPPEIDAPGPILPKHPKLCLPFGLPTAALYSNPGNPADLLPLAYGDFRVGGLRGPVPATLIDRGDPLLGSHGPWVYCGAWMPVVSVEKVYIGDVEQAFSLDTDNPDAAIVVSLSNNFQNVAPILSITFNPDASNRMLSPDGQPIDQVSWRGRGAYDSTGLVVMENAIDQFVHLLTNFGSFELDRDFDLTALDEARARVDGLGYLTAFVVMDRQVTQDWLTEMLFNVMGFWRINGKEQVEIHVDDGGPVAISDLAASIVAARDVIDGDDGVQIVLDKQAIVNALNAYYLYAWSLGQPSSVIVTETDPVSIAAYGEIRKAVTLKGLRRASDVHQWASILFTRQSARTRVEGATVLFQAHGGQFAHLTIGDAIAFTWPYGPTRESGNPYLNQVLRIVDIQLDATRGGAFTISALDMGTYVTGAGGTRLLTPLAL